MNNWVPPCLCACGSSRGTSIYRNIRIVDNEAFGRVLLSDNDLQLAEKDARLYSQSLASPLVEAGIPLDTTWLSSVEVSVGYCTNL